jgi:PIN domain nuclease of toxin-antitoxin system
VKVLLDTHVFLWAIAEPRKLSERARKVLANPLNELILSSLSVWEIILKAQQGKLKLPVSPGFLETHMINLGIESVLAVQPAHVYGLFELPSHHRDPFDRLLISQCRAEGLAFLSADSNVQKYPVKVVW